MAASAGPLAGAGIGSLISVEGYALVGDAERFHAAHGRVRELVEHPTGHQPRWAYYVSPQFADTQGGFYQVSQGMACSRNKRRHLGNAVTLPHVNSPRCLTDLRRLADELRARKANPHIREFSTELDRRLKLVA